MRCTSRSNESFLPQFLNPGLPSTDLRDDIGDVKYAYFLQLRQIFIHFFPTNVIRIANISDYPTPGGDYALQRLDIDLELPWTQIWK